LKTESAHVASRAEGQKMEFYENPKSGGPTCANLSQVSGKELAP